MDRIEARVNGLKEVEAEIKATVERSKRAIPQALRPAAVEMQAEAKRRVRVKTGHIKESIVIRTVKSAPVYSHLKVTLKGGKGGGQGGFPLEVGHVMSGKFEHFGGTVPAYPFMRPAFESKERAVSQGIEQRLIAKVLKGRK